MLYSTKGTTMMLKLTTFPAKAIEPLDRIYLLDDCTMYSVVDVQENEGNTIVLLNEDVMLKLSGIIEPINKIVLIKDV